MPGRMVIVKNVVNYVPEVHLEFDSVSSQGLANCHKADQSGYF